ncbi:MAG: hypothetical protein ACI4DV_06265 [Lachnospiraceae bacterium]
MLFQLFVLRMSPVLLLGMCRKHQEKKSLSIFLGLALFVILAASLVGLVKANGISGILYLFLGMFPQIIFYGFAFFLIYRCIWKEWSVRVWKRIYLIAVLSVLLGIWVECYCNSGLLTLFGKIMKRN